MASRENNGVVIVLDRVTDVPLPPYLILGKAECVYCLHWCWLSASAVKVIQQHRAWPICQPCGAVYCRPGNRIGSVSDDSRETY